MEHAPSYLPPRPNRLRPMKTAMFLHMYRHVLPSLSYGYSPCSLFYERTVSKVAPASAPVLHAPPLLPPPKEANPPSDYEPSHLAHNHDFREAICSPLPPPHSLSGASEAELLPVPSVDSACDRPAFTHVRSSLELQRVLSTPPLFTAPLVIPPLFMPPRRSSAVSNSAASMSTARTLPLPTLSNMRVQDILESGNERLFRELLRFCRMLCCEHWVLFLAALHPYLPSLSQDGGSRFVPRAVVASIYIIFLCPGAPLATPLYGKILDDIQDYCKPRFWHQRASILSRLAEIRRRSNPQRTPQGIRHFLDEVRLLGLQEPTPVDEGEDLTAPSITAMLHVSKTLCTHMLNKLYI